MKNLPAWADGALFGFLLCPLIFILKIFCPPLAVCLADPFLIVMFSPLFILESFETKEYPLVFEMVIIVLFWSVVCAILAHLFSKVAHLFMQEETE